MFRKSESSWIFIAILETVFQSVILHTPDYDPGKAETVVVLPLKMGEHYQQIDG